jgi:two-component system, NtrC family, response regulator AtoC
MESAVNTSLRERVRRAAIKTEGEIIRETLERHRWNRRKTAEALRISYRALMYKMKACNLRDDRQLRDKPSVGDIPNADA